MVEFRKDSDGRVWIGNRAICIYNDGTTGQGMVGLTEDQCSAAWAKFHEQARPELPSGWEWIGDNAACFCGSIFKNGTTDLRVDRLYADEIDAFVEARRIVMEEAER